MPELSAAAAVSWYAVLCSGEFQMEGKRDFRTKYYYNGDRIEPGMEDMFYEAAHLRLQRALHMPARLDTIRESMLCMH